jgi:hypothetical protein
MDYWHKVFLEPLKNAKMQIAKFMYPKDLNTTRSSALDTFRFYLKSDNTRADQTSTHFNNCGHLSAISYPIDHGQIRYRKTASFTASLQQWKRLNRTLPINYLSGPSIAGY